MTAGEKRSLTSSMKKVAETFLEGKSLSTYTSKQTFITDFLNNWVSYSLTNKLSWCYDKKTGEKDFHQQKEFQKEMNEKIAELFEAELSSIKENVIAFTPVKQEESKVRPVRSKKKRLRKKFEKKLAMLA